MKRISQNNTLLYRLDELSTVQCKMKDPADFVMNNSLKLSVNSRLFNKVNMMNSKNILKQALKLKPDERFMLVEGLIKSLDKPDSSLDEIWADEAEKRLNAYRSGELEGVPMEEIFKED